MMIVLSIVLIVMGTSCAHRAHWGLVKGKKGMKGERVGPAGFLRSGFPRSGFPSKEWSVLVVKG